MHIYTDLSYTIGRFKTSQYHPTLVQISWEALQEDIVTGYTVQVVGPGSTREIPTRKKYSTSVEISDLRPFTQYNFKVNAVKGINKVHLIHPIIMHVCMQLPLVLLVN
jgi:hypothetical protein